MRWNVRGKASSNASNSFVPSNSSLTYHKSGLPVGWRGGGWRREQALGDCAAYSSGFRYVQQGNGWRRGPAFGANAAYFLGFRYVQQGGSWRRGQAFGDCAAYSSAFRHVCTGGGWRRGPGLGSAAANCRDLQHKKEGNWLTFCKCASSLLSYYFFPLLFYAGNLRFLSFSFYRLSLPYFLSFNFWASFPAFTSAFVHGTILHTTMYRASS